MAVRTASPALSTRVGRVYREAWRAYRAHPTALLVPVTEALAVSVALIVWFPEVSRVALNVFEPLSPTKKV